MSNIAIIPARGGSKRIPGKNLKLFHGQPVIKYSIDAATGSGLFDAVIVSTDSDAIAKKAVELGAETPFLRPSGIADDFAPLADVLVHALSFFEENGRHFEYACCILPTAPFVTSEDLKTGYGLLRGKEASAAISVAQFSSSIYRSVKILEDGSLGFNWPEYELTRSNDLPAAYHDAGQYYWLHVATFMKQRKIFMPGSVAVVLPRNRVQDIDTPDDWAFAEQLFMREKKN